MECNLQRLARKYKCLEEQERLLRREYHNKDEDMAEKDRFTHERINSLKAWKASAIQQLKFLFEKLRVAVPMTKYQKEQKQHELSQKKVIDLIQRNSKQAD